MKALVVLTQPPLPEGGAPGKCAVALLRGLQAHGVDVHALAARQHFAVAGDPPPDLPVEVIPVAPEPPGWEARVRRLHRPRGDLARGEFAERVREAARNVDVVHLEETETAWCDEGIETPSLVHVHFVVRRDRSLGRPWRKQFRDVLEFSAAERAATRRHKYLVASSPLVLDFLRHSAPDADLVLAPLALDPQYYERALLNGPPTVGIIGTADWPPTRAAVLRLVTRVWPHIRRLVPDAQLKVAGRGMNSLEGLALVPGVKVVGEVSSAAEFLRGLSVLVYPVERGSGMKVKVLESIAMGVPVVTTPAGAEGIAAGFGISVTMEDASLAQATADILLDDAERHQRGAEARKAFEILYTPEVATAPLVDLYQRMAESSSYARRAVAPVPIPQPSGDTPPVVKQKIRATLGWLGAPTNGVELAGRLVVLSPHLDDGVFSLGAAIARGARRGAEITVLTVCAGDPDSDAPAGEWDSQAGFTTVGEAAGVRREEDRRACDLVGARAVWLPFSDDQYSRRRDDDDAVWSALLDAVADADAVLVPGFPLIHADHQWLADLVAHRGLGDARVGLYLEQPYATRWAGEAEVEPEAGDLSPGHADWAPPAAAFQDRIRKIRACRAYSSQLPLLGPHILGRITRYEAASGGESMAWSHAPDTRR